MSYKRQLRKIWSENLVEMKKKLSVYIDKGRAVDYQEVKEEPVIACMQDSSALSLTGDLEIGRLRSGEHLLGSVGISFEAIPLMMGMFGMTGSGKTNIELILNARIINYSPKTVGLICRLC